jgi:signal transduction histidine kinase
MIAGDYQKSIIVLFIKFCFITMLALSAALILTAIPSMRSMYEANRAEDVADIANSYKLIAENYFKDRVYALEQFSKRSVIVNSLMQDLKGNKQLKDLVDNSGVLESSAKISIYNINNELFIGELPFFDQSYLLTATEKIISGKYRQLILVDREQKKVVFIVPIRFRNTVEGALAASIPFDFNRIANLKDVNSQIALKLYEGANYVEAGANPSFFSYPLTFTEKLRFPGLMLRVVVDMQEQYDKSEKLLNQFTIKLIAIIFICIACMYAYGYRQLIKPYIELDEKDKALSKTVEGICKLDRDNLILFSNDAMVELFSSDAVLIGSHFPSFFKGDALREIDATLASYVDEVKTLSLPYELNGELRVIKIHISFVDYDKGLKYCFLQDITEKTKMENLKQTFVSIINHELRTPLTAIQGSLGLVQKLSDNTVNPKVRDLLTICYKNSLRLGLLINDILDVEKISAGKMTYDIQPIELSGLLEEIIKDCSGYTLNHDVSIHFEKTNNEAICNIDQNRFAQVMFNIISNSAKFSPSGSEIEVTMEHISNSKVRIAIKDQGEGIPRKMHSKLFTKFAQGDVSEHNKTKGTGLGLYIAKTFIDEMGGEISFESEEGKGTIFYIMLNIISKDFD